MIALSACMVFFQFIAFINTEKFEAYVAGTNRISIMNFIWVRFSEKCEDCQQPQIWLNGSDSLVYDRVSYEHLEIYLILKLKQR